MSNKEFENQFQAQLSDSPSAPSYEEAMKYPTLPPMDYRVQPPPVQPVILQPQPIHHFTPQPTVVQPNGS